MIDQRALDIAVRKQELLLSAARVGMISFVLNKYLPRIIAEYHRVVRELAR